MKHEPFFVPAGQLEHAIHAGDPDGVIAALRTMSFKERKAGFARLKSVNERINQIRWEKDGKIKAWWGGEASEPQRAAASAAMFFCGGPEARTWEWDWQASLYPYLDLLEPQALKGFAAELVAARSNMMATVQRLVLEGLSDRPDSEAYVIGLICAPRSARGKDLPILNLIDADPALLELVVPRIFDVEGEGDSSMAAIAKYGRGDNNWRYALLELVSAGRLARDWLIERCLHTLEKDWAQFRAGWFSRFHDELAPSLDEMVQLCDRYLGLCHSRIAPTVTMALGALSVLAKGGKVDGADLMAALVPVMSSAVKGQIDAALKLLDAVVKSHPAMAHAAAAVAQRALSHESPDVHKKVIARMAAWGVDDATRGELSAVLPHVSVVHRDALATLLGATVVQECEQVSAMPVATGLVPVLDASRKLAPLDDIDELVQTIAYVFENETAIDDFERTLEALARLVRVLPDAHERFVPVLKRGATLITSERHVACALAHVLEAVFCGTLHSATLDKRSSDFDLERRIADLTLAITSGWGLSPLSSATHMRGFIDPLLLCDRIAAHALAGARATLDEQVRAILRLPAQRAPEALARLQTLAQTPFVQACRYALGDDVDIGGEAPLFVAAARIRFPDQDDARVLLAFGDLGPDGAIAARYTWSYEVWTEFNLSHHIQLEVEPAATHLDPSYIAIRRHNAGGRDYFSWGESNLLYAATILPSSLEAFFAEGAFQIGYNVDWWGARWHDKAFLAVLMDRTVPVTPSAVRMVALALGGKEAGQTALAIDVFVTLLLEERIDVRAVALDIRWALLSVIGKSARYAKSLASAARAHPAMPAHVITALCVMLDVGDCAPPKDTGALLELLLELSLAHQIALPAGGRDMIATLKLTGKGKAAQKQLLARIS